MMTSFVYQGVPHPPGPADNPADTPASARWSGQRAVVRYQTRCAIHPDTAAHVVPAVTPGVRAGCLSATTDGSGHGPHGGIIRWARHAGTPQYRVIAGRACFPAAAPPRLR